MSPSLERFGAGAMLAAIGICCVTSLFAVATGAGVIGAVGGWLVGGGWAMILAGAVLAAAVVIVVRRLQLDRRAPKG